MFMSVHKGEGGVKIVPNPVHVVCERPLSGLFVLCTTEKLSILMANQRTTINKRGELLTMCMHKIKFRFGTFKPSVNQNT